VTGAVPHVLVVEDNAHVASAMRTLFAETGHRVTLAGTAAAAVSACVADRADVMLLDLTLPDGNGLDALTELRALNAAPRMTIALTGHDDAATRTRCLDAGCDEVLLKPVPARELLRLMGQWIASGT